MIMIIVLIKDLFMGYTTFDGCSNPKALYLRILARLTLVTSYFWSIRSVFDADFENIFKNCSNKY